MSLRAKQCLSNGAQLHLVEESRPAPTAPRLILIAGKRLGTTEVFESFWRFAAERQRIFFARGKGAPPPWTEDHIVQRFRFTNAYRAADRVSQFLIRNVQQGGPQDDATVFFRTILFKLFNRIDTWHLLERQVGAIAPETFDPQTYGLILTDALDRGERIYSGAYIMPAAGRVAGRKHEGHLQLLARMLAEALPARLRAAQTMEEAFKLLRSYPMIGDFLAYQYVTDLNYSSLLSFSEMEFVMPGPGAKSGIHKCIADRGTYSDADIIRWTAEQQDEAFASRGLSFQSLWGRPLQLIDVQNLFCEVDKYARVGHPDVAGLGECTRIKQQYRHNAASIDYFFPEKWGITAAVMEWRSEERRVGK